MNEVSATIPLINGNTRVMFIMADPIFHVRTPQAINALMVNRAINAVMVPCHVKAGALSNVLGAMRNMDSAVGSVITAPHKIAAATLCDRLEKFASRVGVVNAIHRSADGTLVGESFDGAGFTSALKMSGHALKGLSAFIAGAGGVASAIAFALAGEGVSSFRLYNRTTAKSEKLLEQLRKHFPDIEVKLSGPDPAGCTLAVNASSLGSRPDDPLPFQLANLGPETIVGDVVMLKKTTPLIEAARIQGCVTQDGHAMLACQLELIVNFLLTGSAETEVIERRTVQDG